MKCNPSAGSQSGSEKFVVSHRIVGERFTSRSQVQFFNSQAAGLLFLKATVATLAKLRVVLWCGQRVRGGGLNGDPSMEMKPAFASRLCSSLSRSVLPRFVTPPEENKPKKASISDYRWFIQPGEEIPGIAACAREIERDLQPRN